jgi:hypothetical protein
MGRILLVIWVGIRRRLWGMVHGNLRNERSMRWRMVGVGMRMM